MSRMSRGLPDVHSVLRDAETKLREKTEYNVDDSFWEKLEQNLKNVTPKNDENIVANIEELIAKAKADIEARKPMNETFGRYRISQDLPDVNTVLSDAKEEIHKFAKYPAKDSFFDELRQNLENTLPENSEVTSAQIDLLIAEAKANMKAKKPIDETFGRYRISQDLPDVNTVLSDAKEEIHKFAKYPAKDSFFDELRQNLENTLPENSEVTSAQIDLLIAEAKANMKAKKPIDETFGRYRISQDLPDVRTVLRDAEKKMYRQAEYRIKEGFWDELKQNLESVTQKNNEVATAQIELFIAKAKANIKAEKPIDEIFEDRYRILRDFPNAHTMLREAEKKLSETTEYCVDKKFWKKLKKDLKKVTLRKQKNINVSINKLILEAKNNMEEKKPVNEIFFNLERELRNFDDVNTMLKEFKKKIIISYNVYDKTFDNFINFLRRELKNLNMDMIIYGKVNEKIEKTKNDLASLEQKLGDVCHEERIPQECEDSILQEIEKLDKNDRIEDNIKAIEKVIENFQSSDAIEANNSFQDSNKDEIMENMQRKLNELYNESIFDINNSASGSKYMEERIFWSKLSKHLLVDEILRGSKSELNAKHIKSVDILVAIPQESGYDTTEEGIKTGIVLLLIIDVDIDIKENKELSSEAFEIGELFLDPINVGTILNLVFDRFHIKNELSEFSKLLSEQPIMRGSSILHIISCPDFAFRFNEDGNMQELAKECEDLIGKFIPEYFTHYTNQENSELNFILRKNPESNDKNASSSALISYSNRLLAIMKKDDLFTKNRDRIIGLQIVSQSYLQRLTQFNKALMSIAIDENRESLLDDKDSDRFNNQLHYTYTTPDELINLSVQDPDAVALRKLLESTTISNQIAIFEERRKAFFSVKENFENQQREEKVDKANKRIQLGIFVLAFITALYNFDISNYGRIYMSLVIILLFIVIYIILKLDISKRFCFYVRSKIFSKLVMSKKFIASQLSPRLLLRKIKKKLRRIF